MTPMLLTVETDPIVLRDYQTAGIEAMREAIRQGSKRVLLVMPTGAGKTATAAEMIRKSNKLGRRVLWLVDRIELAEQAGEAFQRAGVYYETITSNSNVSKFCSAHITTIQAFLARIKAGKYVPYAVDFVVIDEAHRTESDSYQTALALYPDAWVVGLTATPVRGDGKGLGNTYAAMVQPVTMLHLMEHGYLVPPRYYTPSTLDLSMVKAGAGGDYSATAQKKVAEANPQLIGDAVETFARVCPTRRAVAFPGTIAQSLHLRDRFQEAGISCCHIDGDMSKAERSELMRDFRANVYQILTSVDIAIEGLDVPDVSAVIILRPTKSQRIYIQAVGRGLRAFPGKVDCIVLDHAGVYANLGPAEEFADWSLQYGQGSGKKASKKAKAELRDPKEFSCEECKAGFFSSSVCPMCGHEHAVERAPKALIFRPGELEEVTATGRQAAPQITAADKERWYAMFLGIAQGRDNQASGMFREKFGHWPARKHGIKPMRPSAEVLACVQAQRIAYRARMAKINAQAALNITSEAAD